MRISKTALLCGIVIVSLNAVSQTSITMASLRSSGSGSSTQTYFITDQGREGVFYHDTRDLSTPDNGGTVIVSGSKRFKRSYGGAIDVRWFGMKSDWNGSSGSDNTAAFVAAINAAERNQVVMVPLGRYFVRSSIAMPLTTTKKIYLEIYGDIFFAKGAGFIVEGSGQSFKSYGLICGGNAGGTTESTYAAYTGTGVLIKNAMHSQIEVNEVKDFKYGIHLTGDKNGGTPAGCQYNRIKFTVIHHNYVQLRVSTAGATTIRGNWNNVSYFYGGQLGRGSSGAGGTYGLVMIKDASSNAQDPMNGHMFNDISYEGLDKAIILNNANYNSFMGGRFELLAIKEGINFDPVTAIGNKIVGHGALAERAFVPGRQGVNTIISATAVWGSTVNNFLGTEAVASVTPNKLLVTTNKYSVTNFTSNLTNDLYSMTGEYPTVQAQMYRINGVTRSVPYKSTFFHVKTSTAGSPLTLPPNIGMIRVEANQAKVFKIDAGDFARAGEGFFVEYTTPAYPISFVRADNSAEVISSKQFPSGGTYHCVWTSDGMFKVQKLGENEYKTFTQTGTSYTIGNDIKTHFVNFSYGNSTCTLPAAASWPGREITIKNLQAGRTVKVNGVSASDDSVIQGRGAITVRSDGSTWNVISFYQRGLTY